MTELVPAQRGFPAHHDILGVFFEGRSTATIRAYKADLNAFASYLNVNTSTAAQMLLQSDAGRANEIVLRYRNSMVAVGLKPATINRRIAAVRSLVKLGRTLGVLAWDIEIKGVKNEVYRDTRGPGLDGVRRVLNVLSRRSTPKAIRDTAIVRLMFDLALRCSEVTGLDVEHVDLAAKRVAVKRKGRTAREAMTLPEPTVLALTEWLRVRDDREGALFLNMNRAQKGKRLTSNGVYRIMKRLGQDIGRRLRPHGLRHAAITQALDLTTGDVRSVAKFSSHRSIQTVLLYDDNRTDAAGHVAQLVAESV